MLCCVGLVAGYAVGQALGGPWTLIAPAAGLGVGLAADMRLVKGLHKKQDRQDAEFRVKTAPAPVAAIAVDERESQHERVALARRSYR